MEGQPPKSATVTGGNFTGEAYVGKNKVEVYSVKEGPPLTTDPSNTPTKTTTLVATDSAEVAAGTKEKPHAVTLDVKAK